MSLEGIKRPESCVMGSTAVPGDNKAMHELVTKEGSSSRSRHFERATIFVKYAVQRLMVTCYLVDTKLMIADIYQGDRRGDVSADARAAA